jgi:arginyl-tRNA synthetase
VDLTAEGMDEKLLLRSNGTSVYITQDLGTAIERQKEFHFNKLVYVVGNEQDYHFKVLFLTLKKLGYAWAEKLHHLSYGMVDLPSGKMKSREGTVVDADDIMQEMINTAKQKTNELGKANDLSPEEATTLYHTLGMAALKYYILKVDPKKRMLFNPEESIDFNGNTGPFIQYTYARIQSLVKKAGANDVTSLMHTQLHLREKRVIQLLHDYEKIIHEAADTYNPGQVANYVYELAKEYNQFYHECPLLKANNEQEKIFRKQLSQKTGEVIKRSLNVLGIEVPERM